MRLHEAAGAHTIIPLAARRSDLAPRRRPRRPSSTAPSGSPTARAATGSSAPTRWAPAGWASDPPTSVADPRGELHDTKGVWIGDASAFPTSSGTNPMVSIMALARRTAEAIADDAGARCASRKQVQHGGPRWQLRPPQRPRTATPPSRSTATRSTSGASGSSPPAPGTIEVLDSTTEEVIGRVPEGTPEDVDRAVAAARGGFEAWSAVPLEEPPRRLHGDRRRARRAGDELAALIAAEVGMPLASRARSRPGCRRWTSAAWPRSPARSSGRSRSATRSSCASRSASSARSPPGTTRCTSSAPRSPRRSRRAARWSPSPAR